MRSSKTTVQGGGGTRQGPKPPGVSMCIGVIWLALTDTAIPMSTTHPLTSSTPRADRPRRRSILCGIDPSLSFRVPWHGCVVFPLTETPTPALLPLSGDTTVPTRGHHCPHAGTPCAHEGLPRVAYGEGFHGALTAQ